MMNFDVLAGFHEPDASSKYGVVNELSIGVTTL